jgi:sec-independent protein translocase protein TatB
VFGLDLPQLLLLALVGFVCVGPERLPTLARDAGRMLRQLRQMADGASAELRAQLPNAAEYGLDNVQSLRDLHPKNLIGKALFDDENGPDLFGDRPAGAVETRAAEPVYGGGGALSAPALARTPVVREAGSPPPYDLDAT